MSNNSNNRNRNRSGSNREWDNDVNRNYESRGFENERRYGSGAGQNQGDYGNNYSGGNYRSDNDADDNRGMYGNSGGMNRNSGSYSSRDNSGWNDHSERNYRGNEYGREGYENDRNRNENRDWWDKTKDEVSSWFGDENANRRRQRDEKQGEHRGKGPKGYTRSDERIKDDVNDRLSDDSNIDASEIEVSVNNCEVTLTGTVNNRWEKRHAEDLVESVSGVKNVENRLRVGSGSNTGTLAGGSPASGTTYVTGKSTQATNFESSKS